MRKIVYLASLLVRILTTRGQQQLSYAYDAAGNRISRTIVSNNSPSLWMYTIQLQKNKQETENSEKTNRLFEEYSKRESRDRRYGPSVYAVSTGRQVVQQG